MEEFEADAVEIRFCFIEIDEQEFLNEAGFDESQLNIDDDRMQDALNYFVDWSWTEVSIKLIENPKWNDGEIIDKSHYYPIYQDQKKKCCNADCFDSVEGDTVYCSFHKSL